MDEYTAPKGFVHLARSLERRLADVRNEARDEMRAANEKITELFTHSKQFYERSLDLGSQLTESRAHAERLADALERIKNDGDRPMSMRVASPKSIAADALAAYGAAKGEEVAK